MNDQTRRDALQDLVSLRVPVAQAVRRLEQFPWDSDRRLVALTRADVCGVLDAYLEERLSAEDVEAWAFALEGRDDVAFEEGFAPLLRDLLFALANPLLTGPVTPSTVRSRRDLLA